METSLRYRGEDKHLQLHAKENFLLDKSFYLRVHGSLNTNTGEPSAVVQLKKRLFPEFLTNFDIGARFDSKLREFTYDFQGKRSIPLSDDGLLSMDLKAGYKYNPTSKFGTPRSVMELSYKLFNFTEDQDLKLKLGYNVINRRPYFQLRENNWSVNAHGDGSWSVIYDL